MAQSNPMARKHPWLMAFGIIAGTVVLAVAALAVFVYVAFATGGF